MQMSIKDLRYRRTEQLLCSSLFDLLEEKNFNDVKISELTNRAGISRQAFYSHYEDKYDFLDHLNHLLIIQLQSFLLIKMKNPRRIALLIAVFDHLLKDREFCLKIKRLYAVNQTIQEPNFDCLERRLEKLFSSYFDGHSWKTDCYCQTEYFHEFLGKTITHALLSAISNNSEIPLRILHTHLCLFDC